MTVTLRLPTTEQGREQLSRKIAELRAANVAKIIRNLACTDEEKDQLFAKVIELAENSMK
ncbi:MAG: hypothetical protein E7559_03185 [Ruminococcaceae bacterium]|nr:hypothetical protein [Oscillospiraceae bacterium]